MAQKLIYKQLVRFDFNVTCANNGAEAVDIWQKQPEGYFQMGFFDHHMPKVWIDVVACMQWLGRIKC